MLNTRVFAEKSLVLPSMLHHLALGCLNLEPMVSFYERHTPLCFLQNNYEKNGDLRSTWLTHEGFILMLELTSEKRQKVVGTGAGLFLIAFKLTNETQLREQLAQAKIEVESETASSIYLRDPEGHRLAFSKFPANLKGH